MTAIKLGGSSSKDYGVSTYKTGVATAARKNDKGMYPDAFCKINPMRGVPGWVEFMHADGAGTKIILAYLYWRETGDMSVWRDIVQDSIVMNLDDVACAGGMTGWLMLASGLNRNTYRLPDETGVLDAMFEGENIFLGRMREYGIDIIGQCGETADVPDGTPTKLLDNTLHCRMQEKNVIKGDIDVGHYIVGFRSYGPPTKWEDSYNGGLGSNGLTPTRHGSLSKMYRWKYPESYDKIMDGKYWWLARLNGLLDSRGLHFKDKFKSYRGTMTLTQPIEVETGEKIPFGKLALSPTRTFAPVMKALHEAGFGPEQISAAIHNSGGGQTKVLTKLSKPVAVVKNNMFPVPKLIEVIMETAGIGWQKALQDFNMGSRFELYVRSLSDANQVVKISESMGVPAKIIGMVEKTSRTEPALYITNQHGRLFEYTR